MDREEMTALLEGGPVTITMNNGSRYTVTPDSQPSCSDIALSFLAKSPDGRWRHVYLPLVTMAEVIAEAPTS